MKKSHGSPRRLATFILISASAALVSCATKLPQPVTGQTCCNLHPDYGWVSSTNMLGGPIVPAGEPVVIDTMNQGSTGTRP